MPKLASPLSGETLYLYVSVSDYSLSAVLLAERHKQQCPIYYISHTFRGSESRYSPIEKSLFALVMASRKLKPYFLSHPIVIRTSQPMRKLLEIKNQSARVVDWVNQLADYGIEYEPRTTIKAQALADFIAEMTGSMEEVPSEEAWKFYVNSSSTRLCSGAGLLIISPNGARLEHAVRFKFMATNNEAKYEALLLGLGICLASGAKMVIAHTNSQLIAEHVNGNYEAKDDGMKMYFVKVQEAIEKFNSVVIVHIPRSENALADTLSR